MLVLEEPFASDNSGNVSVTCDVHSRANFTIGQTPVTCEAVDGSGNKADCSFHITVTGKFISYKHRLHML